MPRKTIALRCPFTVVAVFAVANLGCSQRPAEAQTSPVAVAADDQASEAQTRRRLSSTEQALLDSAGVQYGAYAELLLTFSDGGRLPLFHERVDLGDDDPRQAMENYRKLTELTDRLIEQRDRAQKAMKQLSNRSGSSDPMNNFWSLQLLQLVPTSNIAFLGIDSLLEPGWKFWAWADNARKRARADVLGIAYADPEKNKIHAGEQKMLRQRIYQVAKQQFGDDPNVGGSEIEFYQNLKDGKLDHLSQRIHAEMSQDATDAGLTYMSVAATQGKRPIDKVYQEGCEGLKHGVDLYVAAGKAVVTGGLGPSAGKQFEKGWDKAKDACDKIEEAEKEYKKFKEDPGGYLQDKVAEKVQEKVEDFATKKGEELFDRARKNIKGFREGEKFVRDANDLKNEIDEAVKDPKEYLLGKVAGKLKIGERVNKFLKDKTNLSDDTTKFLSEKISESITEMGRNVVIGEIVDKELKKAGGDPEKVDLKKPLRRIKDAGWGYGAVAVKSKGNNADSGGTIAVWKGPTTGRVKTTLQPVATGKSDVIPLPSNSQADVLEVDDQGQVESITERPVTVAPDQVVSVDPDNGTTKTVSYDDHFVKDASDALVDADNHNTPGTINVMHGVNKVDLSQLFPHTDDSDEPMEIVDYDADSDDPQQADIWADEHEDGPTKIADHDAGSPPRRQDSNGPGEYKGGPTTLGNLTDRIKNSRINTRKSTGKNNSNGPGEYKGGPTTLGNLTDRIKSSRINTRKSTGQHNN